MRDARGVWLVAVAMIVLVAGAAAPGAWALDLSAAQIFIEINSTDGDSGIQIALDGEGWERMRVFDPTGRKILDISGKGSVGAQGITELALESAEPSFDDQPLSELLEMFPEGMYTFEGLTTDKVELTGEAMLTHDLPVGPVLISPGEGDETVDPENTVVEWQLVPDPPGSAIVGYEVIVETEEDPLRVFKVDVSNETTRVTVPAEFMEAGTAYKWEVLAVETSGNQTISESDFETLEDD